jgi:heterotetrameric sarcosine oxidase gamma subunit
METDCVAEIAPSRPRARTPFEGLAVPGRYGRQDGSAGVVVEERAGRGIVHCAALRGQAERVRDAVRSHAAIILPERPQRVVAGELAALWCGPAQWLVVAEGARAESLEADLSSVLAGLAAVAGIGDGRAVLRIAGPSARRVLAKGVGLDLDPSVFGPGATALTMASLIDVQLSCLGADVYEIMLFRGFAGSFWHWLEESALDEGLEVLPAG